METMIKESRCEIFTSSRGQETDRIFKAKTFFCTSNSSTPQLLNRQKTSNSFKSLSNIEHIELETNDIYQFNHRNSKLAVANNTTDIINPIIKEKRSKLTNSKILHDTGSDTYRDNEELDEFNLNNNNNNSSSSNTKLEKKLAGIEKQKTTAKLKNNVANKLSKQKSELSSTNNLSSLRDANNLINNFTTNSLIATKLSYGGEKSQKQKKSKKSKNKSKNNKNAGTESGINDMFRVTEMNAAKMKLKPSESSHKLNSKSKANGSNSNGSNAMNNNNNNNSAFEGLNRTTSALDKDYLVNESLRWQHELDNEEEELKRIELYKINRRKRYIEQRNKYLMLSNNSSSFLPYLHYENDSPRESQQFKANQKAGSDCEHTRDASKEIKLVEADGAFVETDKHGNNTLKEVNTKLTDSAISSLSSTSR